MSNYDEAERFLHKYVPDGTTAERALVYAVLAVCDAIGGADARRETEKAPTRARDAQHLPVVTDADIQNLQQRHPPVHDYDPTHWDDPVPGVEGLLGRQAIWARYKPLLDSGVLRLPELIVETDDTEVLYAIQEEASTWARAQGANAATLDLLEQMVDLRMAQVAMQDEPSETAAGSRAHGAPPGPQVEWHAYDPHDKATAPLRVHWGDVLWIVEEFYFDGDVTVGVYDGVTFRVLPSGSDDCSVTHWALITVPRGPEVTS